MIADVKEIHLKRLNYNKYELLAMYPCCEEMKEATQKPASYETYSRTFPYVSFADDFDHNQDKQFKINTSCNATDDEETLFDRQFMPISFCPFCGTRIEVNVKKFEERE